MRYLLDTCVISEALKPQPETSVLQWLDDRDEDALHLSALTIGELQKGITKLTDGRRQRALQTWVEKDLVTRFAGRVLSVDSDVAVRWGVLQGEAAKLGRGLPVIDSLLAATALAHDLQLVTRNVADFERCRVGLVNPWAS